MPRRLLRDGLIVDDDWSYAAEADGNAAAALILTLAQWQNDRDAWIARGGRLGVVLLPADRVERLAADLPLLSLIACSFSGPSEGRGYSQARGLRERWNFAGELRATGYVRRDQLFFMARCGFNSFELPDTDLQEGASAFTTFSTAYQPSNDAGLPFKLQQRRPDTPASAGSARPLSVRR
jgi:uncharacterized protein (DUF934 family)